MVLNYSWEGLEYSRGDNPSIVAPLQDPNNTCIIGIFGETPCCFEEAWLPLWLLSQVQGQPVSEHTWQGVLRASGRQRPLALTLLPLDPRPEVGAAMERLLGTLEHGRGVPCATL